MAADVNVTDNEARRKRGLGKVIESEEEWVQQNAGRRLKPPKCKTLLSLPEWMIKSSDVHRARCQKQLVEPQPSATTKLSRRLSARRNSAMMAQLEAKVTIEPRSEDKPISTELQRRKKLHPRLRWPRLAQDTTGGIGDPGITNVNHEDDGEQSKQESPIIVASKVFTAEDLDPKTGLLKPDVISPDSVFYPGALMPTEPEWDRVKWTKESGPPKTADDPMNPALLPRLGRNIGGSIETTKALQKAAAGKMVLLSRVKPSIEVGVGNSATVHLPRLDGSLLDHRARARNGGSCATDRKYCLRQAPFSHIMARDYPAPGDSSSSPRSHQIGSNRRRLQSEYINFEGWGIDDGYIEMLCKRADLAKIKYMNFSDNRLTEQGIKHWLEHHGETTWDVQSLQLAKNNLEELGGLALAHLLEMIRPPLRELDLSENLIGDKAGIELCDVLASRCHLLHGLTLANNELGRAEKMGNALARLMESAKNLEVLDLHWNLFHGTGAAHAFHGLYENGVHEGGKLRRLNLAWNRLGMRCAGSQRMIQGLAAVFKDNQILFHLDLSYNGLCAEECAILADNLKHNHSLFGLHLIGNEAIVDELGFVTPNGDFSVEGNSEAMKAVEAQDKLNRLAESVPSKLRLDMTPLVISGREVVDKSSKIVAEKYKRVSTVPETQALEKPSLHHSPFSLLSEGPPDIRVADVAPELGLFGGFRANPSLRGLSSTGVEYPQAFSKEDMQLEKEWAKARSQAQQSIKFGVMQCGEVRRNAQCCWICENWVDQRVSYIPGWSGPEQSVDEVVSVSAYFSIDGFARPTKLARVEEPYQRRLFEDNHRTGKSPRRREHMQMHALNRKPTPCLTEQGRVVRWTGCRMLPPTTVAIQVIFQVNDRIVTADDLPSKAMPVPKAMRLHPVKGTVASPSVTAGSSNWMKSDPIMSVAGSASGENDPSVVEITKVNVVSVGMSAWDRFELGDATALIILEDPERRGEINVLPRRMGEVHVPQPDVAWSFDRSEFMGYSTDTADVGEKLFDYDFKMTKLEAAIRDPSVRDDLSSFMRSHYIQLVMAFRHYAFFGFRSRHHAAGLVLLAFTDLMADYGGTSGDAVDAPGTVGTRTGARKTHATTRPSSPSSVQTHRETPPPTGDTLFKRNFLPAIADTVFIASSVIDKERRRALLGMPEKGLARFQFLESFVRIAQRRFQDPAEEEDACGAVKALWRMTSMGQNLLDLRRSLHKHLFCEECDLVYKEYRHMLEGVYVTYKDFYSYPGRIGTGMTYGAWEQLLQDAKIDEAGVSIREAGVAFAIGKELRLDEYSSMRHMELSWSEFLVCLGATMMLRADWESEFFADMLADFFADQLSQARQSRSDNSAYGSHNGFNDVGLSQVLQLVSKVFMEADDDGSGTLSVREFRVCMAQPQVQQEMKDIGLALEDLSTFFSTIDKDGSGDVTLDELCEGFIKMKLSMRGTDRSVAYFRKAFAEADLDSNGTLSMEEFSALCSNAKVLKRLAALGVQVDEVSTLFETLTLRKGGKTVGTGKDLGLTADDMIAGFLAIRDTGLGESRGINFLRQIFLEADIDDSNSLSREEMQRAFCTPKVSQKLQRLRLKEPDWMAIFDALDVDGNGDISWSELSQGICQLWKQAIDEEVALEARHMSDAVTSGGRQPSLQKTSTDLSNKAGKGTLSVSGSSSTLAAPSPALLSVSPSVGGATSVQSLVSDGMKTPNTLV